MPSKALEILVGLFVSLGIAAVLVLTLRIASLQDVGGAKGSYFVKAKFENVGKLSAGNSVKVAGVTVGRVKSIGVDPTDFEALVTMEISGDYDNIPKDTNAKILTAGLLGEQYIGLEPGGDDASLKNGDTITFTQSAFVLENIIGQFLVSATQKSGGKSGESDGEDQKSGAKEPTKEAN
jgi:phospholipid/cholesterol/gamma-HCH transport system substrate-binding protein